MPLDLAIDLGMPDLADAVCRDKDPEVFFAFEPHRIAQAQALCRRCPAIRPCLQWALDHREQGVWAATTEDQRKELLSRHARTDP